MAPNSGGGVFQIAAKITPPRTSKICCCFLCAAHAALVLLLVELLGEAPVGEVVHAGRWKQAQALSKTEQKPERRASRHGADQDLTVPTLSSLRASLSSSFAAGPSAAGDDDLLSRERRHNRLLLSVWDDEELRQLLLDAATTSDNNDDASLYLLLPQSVTLVDVRITREVLETHLVLLQSAARGGEPRPFTSLNGLHGSVLGDGGVAVHQRLRRAAEEDPLGSSVGGWSTRPRRQAAAARIADCAAGDDAATEPRRPQGAD